jgi:hypothetical protein
MKGMKTKRVSSMKQMVHVAKMRNMYKSLVENTEWKETTEQTCAWIGGYY